jgi:hypothetical protein
MSLQTPQSLPLPHESPYATHLPMLRFLLETFRPARIIEFGMGEFSTRLFAQSAADVISIESDPFWFQRGWTGAATHHRVLWPTEAIQDYLLDPHQSEFDLAFVDGPEESRVPCVNRLIGRARMIVIHDSLTRCYGWHRLQIPVDYGRVDDNRLPPATSVFARRTDDLLRINSFCAEPLFQRGTQ